MLLLSIYGVGKSNAPIRHALLDRYVTGDHIIMYTYYDNDTRAYTHDLRTIAIIYNNTLWSSLV